jgi:transposase
MKIQEVILKVIGGQLRWIQAAEILGISARTMHRWKQHYERQGYDGLCDRRTRRPSPRRVPLPLVQQVLRLYREHYFDFNVRHFHERLQEAHGIHLSYTWVKTSYSQNIRTRVPTGDYASTIARASACLPLHSHLYSAPIGTAQAEEGGDGLETGAALGRVAMHAKRVTSGKADVS